MPSKLGNELATLQRQLTVHGRGNPIQNLYVPMVASKVKSRPWVLKHAKMCDKFTQLQGP